MKRTLSLRREALIDLTPGELGGVVGGNYTSQDGISCDVRQCVGEVHVDDALWTIPSRLITCHSCVSFPVLGC